MKGASTEPWAITNSVPTVSRARMMGSSHHFLRTRINAQSSRAMFGCLMSDPPEFVTRNATAAKSGLGVRPRGVAREQQMWHGLFFAHSAGLRVGSPARPTHLARPLEREERRSGRSAVGDEVRSSLRRRTH